jgi:hypothetical protein
MQFSWWEPGTPSVLDIGDASAILFFFIALVTAVVGIARWWSNHLKNMIIDIVGKATEPIHPSSNGGFSLPDIARKVNKLETSLESIRKDQIATRDIILQVLIDKDIKSKRPVTKKTA